MTGEKHSDPDFSLEDLAEIYGEDTAWVPQNDIDRLRSELSAEGFIELSARLGWEQPEGDDNAA